MQKNPPFEKWKTSEDKTRLARKALLTLSPPLQARLCEGLAAQDKAWFDARLNTLEMDGATRAAILKEVLQDAPALRPPQSERVVARCFRRKVNTLRCIGRGAVRSAFDELVPGALAAASEASGGGGLAAGGAGELTPAAIIAQTRAAKLQRRAARRAPKEAKAATAADVAAPAEALAAQGGAPMECQALGGPAAAPIVHAGGAPMECQPLGGLAAAAPSVRHAGATPMESQPLG
eukprot:CAMPEP_0176095650 /NCGR_PEP_ID=MMETSP0120_2-20121206/47945_1 /TAXON_ID=160619 /ORGANISM="Kryptoperidinium foliaceum, Strain CCMP 1326" /LENGTH=234 /DNA_ID=CAMNT_0017429623 /DNA_START=95 /DNA_END=796 /DNA_ORIENTATION=-